MATSEILRVHGLDLSYFTGKLEAYLRLKNIPYELVEMDTADFKRCGTLTGVAQMPQVEWQAGQWLSDTTLIIEFLEKQYPAHSVLPSALHMAFLAQLLEDFGDEWLWRPALYYRWAHATDARLMSHRLGQGMLRDVPLPLFLRRWAILNRQRFHFLWRDGVRPSTAQRIQGHYLETLDALEGLFRRQPFLLGLRPTLADIGLYGSMFRHFFCDPTPASIMRKQAPAVHEWVARLWNTQLEDYSKVCMPTDCNEALNPLLNIVTREFLPYMQANEAALLAGQSQFRFNSQGTLFKLPVQRYRAWRFQRLRTRWQALPAEAQQQLDRRFPELRTWLDQAVDQPVQARIATLPITAATTVTGRAW